MMNFLAAPLGAVLLVFAVPCQAQPTPTPVARPGAFVLEAGSHEMPDLIDRVAAFLDYNVLYQATELAAVGANQVRVTRRTEVDAKGCWELFGSLLYHKGLAVLALDAGKGFYEVIAINGPRRGEIVSGAMFVPCGELAAYANQRATPILTTVSLQNVNATIATNALRPFFASTGNQQGLTLGNVGNSSDLLVQGFGPQVHAAYQMLRLVDVGSDNLSQPVRIVKLQHAAADDMVARIDQILGGRAALQAQMAGGMAPLGMLRAVAHPALNAVILSGQGAQIREALDLIAGLDMPAVAETRAAEDVGRRLKQIEERLLKLEQVRAEK